MSRIQRRQFLQFAGSTLATLGLSQFDLIQQAGRYGKALAQAKPGRKLALLVGINHYPEAIPDLQGCLTDIELQWELLVHRYGFSPQDILVVADRKLSILNYTPALPTRQNILEAFEQHLIRQAQPGDAVVFHYSGHGSFVKDPHPLPTLIRNENGQKKVIPNHLGITGTMVPTDRLTSHPDQVQDIMGRSLFLLMHALKTDNVTVVLDSCHSGGSTRGNLQARTVPSRLDDSAPATPSPIELEYQKRWIKDLQLSDTKLHEMRQRGITKGVAIGSAQYDQWAADTPFDGKTFYAGAFTYLLTRYLWQQSIEESIETVFVNLIRSTQDIAHRSGINQEPIFDTNPSSNRQQPAYFLQPTVPFAEAVVRSLNSDGTLQYWLGGISSLSLEANSSGSIFSIITANSQEIAQVEQISRQGLLATGKLIQGKLTDLQPGMLMRERVRGLPVNLKLRVGLDPSLGDELATVQTALQAIDRIEVVTSEQSMHYRVGRATPDYRTQWQQRALKNLPPIGSLGLLTADLCPLTPTFDQPEETVADAITRLTPRLKAFLAAEVLKAIGGVDVVQGQRGAGLAVQIKPTGNTGKQIAPNRFQVGTQIQIQVQNTDDRDAYVTVISIGDAGRMRVLFPYSDAPEESARLPVNQTLTLPEPRVIFSLNQPGTLEIMVLSSADPIRDALKAFRELGARCEESPSRGVFSNPIQCNDTLNLVQNLLGNIDRNTRSKISVSPSVQAVNVDRYAVISAIIEIV